MISYTDKKHNRKDNYILYFHVNLKLKVVKIQNDVLTKEKISRDFYHQTSYAACIFGTLLGSCNFLTPDLTIKADDYVPLATGTGLHKVDTINSRRHCIRCR